MVGTRQVVSDYQVSSLVKIKVQDEVRNTCLAQLLREKIALGNTQLYEPKGLPK